MQRILLFTLFFCSSFAMAQPTIDWGPEIEIADGAIYGNIRPRIALTAGDIPVVIWGEGLEGNLYTARLNGTVFTQPTNILPENVATYLTSWTGPDIAAKGDTVVAVFKQVPLETGHVLTVRSLDGGITWSDTIRADSHNNGGVVWLPSMDMDEEGNPSIIYMAHDPVWTAPHYVVSHSTDHGMTYQVEMNIATSIPDEACDCCPAEYVIDGNQHALLFRNNTSNIRDIFAVYSEDDGLTYPEYGNVDQLNWNVSSCPSTGPDGVFNNGTMLTVYASRAEGNYRVYLSSTATNPGFGFISRSMMTAPLNMNGSQNFPRIDGSNDTIVMIWQESETSNYEIYSAITTTGDLSQLMNSKALVNISTSGTQSHPDILYSNGLIHAVYQDAPTGSVIYRQGTVGALGLEDDSPSAIRIFPNPSTSGTFRLTGNPESVEVYDTSGKPISFDIQKLLSQTILKLTEDLPGVFFLKCTYDGTSTIMKLVCL